MPVYKKVPQHHNPNRKELCDVGSKLTGSAIGEVAAIGNP
jgi:hypothetical protein